MSLPRALPYPERAVRSRSDHGSDVLQPRNGGRTGRRAQPGGHRCEFGLAARSHSGFLAAIRPACGICDSRAVAGALRARGLTSCVAEIARLRQSQPKCRTMTKRHGLARRCCALGFHSYARWHAGDIRAAAKDRCVGLGCGWAADQAAQCERASRQGGTRRPLYQAGPLAQNPLGGKHQHYQAEHGKPVPQIALSCCGPHLGRKRAVSAQHFRECFQGGAAEKCSA